MVTFTTKLAVQSFPTLLMFSHGQVYKFSEARKLDVLLDYAKVGGRARRSLVVCFVDIDTSSRENDEGSFVR